MAMCRARVRVSGGVAGTSSILKSGWKAEKWSGTSGPRWPATHSESAPTSASESLSPGMRSVVSSSQVRPSCASHSSVSSTGARWAKQSRW